ncbi:predicted protein [Histoplasma capsulatum G186AR]|uniref:Uncharacterized protein n=1 Tax=Ajellomyces capsulatus (strain G186AR / H82 / ATCC MYA-2454 / RMSCC 2432) TaxID=447093 RepID=C0NND4_AJECG|nr:uncharacterized protein HCBG_04261 [Histoplasma capsulatum G186AR]EEH07382.1 predicted protein [Histoplasma capsulatum G186AR]
MGIISLQLRGSQGVERRGNTNDYLHCSHGFSIFGPTDAIEVLGNESDMVINAAELHPEPKHPLSPPDASKIRHHLSKEAIMLTRYGRMGSMNGGFILPSGSSGQYGVVFVAKATTPSLEDIVHSDKASRTSRQEVGPSEDDLSRTLVVVLMR